MVYILSVSATAGSLMASQALYAGTFDPFTNGHWDIAERALKIFDSLVILVASPPHKRVLFQPEKRVEMIRHIFHDEPQIEVNSWEHLIVDYAQENGIKVIVRGLRPTGDFDNEFQMASMNRRLNRNIESIFITTCEDTYCLSSSLVKEIFHHGGDVKDFVHPVVQQEMEKLHSHQKREYKK